MLRLSRLCAAAAACVASVVGWGDSVAWAEDRLALVVGAADYGRDRRSRERDGFIVPGALANAVRDARTVGQALRTAGFKVTRLENPSKRQLQAAVGRLGQDLREAGDDAVGVFYFAGHGAQGRPPNERDIDNYLLPIGADLLTEADLEAEALGLSRVSATLSGAGEQAVVIILDACRNFALPQANRSALTTRGLAEARASANTLIAYATAPGDVANDGPPGGNGPYAYALSRELRQAEGARIQDVFAAVRRQVLETTEGAQQPWENSSLLDAVVIGEEAPVAAAPAPVGPGVVPGDPLGVIWATLTQPCEFKEFAEVYPDSVYANLARRRGAGCVETPDAPAPRQEASVGATIPSVDAPTITIPRIEPADDPDDPAVLIEDAQTLLGAMGYPVGEADGVMGPATRRALFQFCRARGEVCPQTVDASVVSLLQDAERGGHAYEPPEPGAGAAGAKASAEAGGPVSARVFQECAACPEMVALPAGRFTMGSADGERNQRPARSVRIPAPFAIARYETTWDEWTACARAGACAAEAHGRGRSDNEWGRGRRPVIHVSWDETQGFVRWLNNQVPGSPYRLPSEAEWEYAARAGSTAAYAWGGNAPSCARGASAGANFDACRDNRTHVAGSYAANRLGLYDLHGNVWEWVADCYRDSYEGAPTNGAPVTTGGCTQRVLRGGSWYTPPRYLASSHRHRYASRSRDNDVGFRVARGL